MAYYFYEAIEIMSIIVHIITKSPQVYTSLDIKTKRYVQSQMVNNAQNMFSILICR